MTEEPFHEEEREISLPATEEKRFVLTDERIRDIALLLEDDHIDETRNACLELTPPDLADLLEKLDPDSRRKIVDILDEDIDPEAFAYMDEGVRTSILRDMDAPRVAQIVKELDSDDALRLIENLDEERQKEILRSLSRKVRAVVEAGLTFPEESAGRLMQREFVAIPQFWTIGKTVDYLRAAAEALPDKFYDVYIVDPMHRFVGAVPLSRVLCSQRAVKVDTLVDDEHATIPVTMDREQVAHLFRRNDLLSAPVTGDDGKLLGVITVDDIVDVIDEEAEEDILKLAGVSDSDLYRSTFSTARSRSTWLLVNLFTAFIAAGVIGMFEKSIEKIVALAILMPIVASMGGNAGTQALTVSVRALATKELSAANAWRVVGKESLVGLINGLLFACLLGLAVFWWFRDAELGAVIAAALAANLLIAGFFGALIPITLNRLGLDPAPAAGVFLTTVTDVIGFMTFLGLATVFLL